MSFIVMSEQDFNTLAAIFFFAGVVTGEIMFLVIWWFRGRKR